MTGTYFDTVVKIEVWGADSKIMDGCKDICEKYEQLLSPTIDSSEISQINQAQGASVSVSKETADLIELGKYYGDLSGGKFDITPASASDLWNFHDNADHSIPDAGQLAEAVTHINYKNIEVNGTTVTMSDPYAKIDLGGIAKGYIADQVKNYLVEEGIKRMVTTFGSVSRNHLQKTGQLWLFFRYLISPSYLPEITNDTLRKTERFTIISLTLLQDIQ